MSAGDPNPFVNSKPFGIIQVSGYTLPGYLQTIDGCETPEEWLFQRGTGTNFATSVWRGSKLAEGIVATFKIVNEATYNKISPAILIFRPKRGVKPTTWVISNPLINMVGITKVSIGSIQAPKETAVGSRQWTWSVKFVEVNTPTSARAGPGGPAINPTAPTPKTEIQNKLAARMAELNKLRH